MVAIRATMPAIILIIVEKMTMLGYGQHAGSPELLSDLNVRNHEKQSTTQTALSVDTM